jgi:TonB dependent receptor-like, beta-barrel
MQSDPRKAWRINPFTDCSTCSGNPEFVATPDSPFDNWNPIGDIGGPIFQDKAWFYFGASYNRTDTERTTTFRNSPPPYETRTLTTWSDSKYYNWNGVAQLNRAMRLRVSGANTRAANRGSLPTSTGNNPQLQPDGSFFADGTPTDGFNTATWDADPEKFKDRWERTGGNGRNDLYSANLDWVLTPKFFVNIQSGYYAYDSTTPPEFAGTQLIHSFAQNLQCTGAAGSATCPFPEVPSNLLQLSGYSDNKSTSRTLQDLYTRSYVNANTTWFKSWAGEHQFKFGARFERLGNDADLGPQLPTVSLQWNRALTTNDGRTVRGQYGYYTVSRGNYTQGSVRSNNWSFWAQDSWTIKNNFTINAGVRTENEHVPSYQAEFPGIEYGFRDKIAPRLGFAYDIKGDSRWKAYGSYGRYFDITKLEMPRGSFGADHWVIYYWTLDTFNWPSINCQEGTTGCPGTYITQQDNRHPANQADSRLTSYFGREQNTLDPNLKPVQTGEMTFGLDHELNGLMSVGVRYTHKWLDRTIEDSGILIPDVGEVFFIANPGYGVAEQILPEPAPPMPKAKRDYDGVEFRLTKRYSDRWQLITSYLWSRLYGNYGGLASSDENGRTSPNVDRYFDGMYLLFDKSGDPVFGLLPTDRPHYWKTQVTYDLPWGTLVGMNSTVTSGTPVSTTINLLGFSPTFINGRGDRGRTPVTSSFDLLLQHEFRLLGHRRVNVNLNVDNLFDQDGVTGYTSTPWRDNFSGVPGFAGTAPPGVLSPRDAYLLNGYDPVALVSSLRAAGTNIRDNSLFGKPSGFQGRRQLRVGIKYMF